jgi:hypothetical protein
VIPPFEKRFGCCFDGSCLLQSLNCVPSPGCHISFGVVGLIVRSVRVRRCQQRALLTHNIQVFPCWDLWWSSILCKNLWSATAMQPKCGVKVCWNSRDHCCQWWAQALERSGARHRFPNYCLEKTKCCSICDNNSFKTYLKVCHMCHAQQEWIEIEINVKFQNISGGILENSFKSESESESELFMEADKSSTVIPPLLSSYCYMCRLWIARQILHNYVATTFHQLNSEVGFMSQHEHSRQCYVLTQVFTAYLCQLNSAFRNVVAEEINLLVE